MGSLNKLRLLHQLRKNQWLKPSELKEIQLKKLRFIIKHAFDNTQFYHEKFKNEGLRPEDITALKDLEKIPITTKEEVRTHSLNTMLAPEINIENCRVLPTSGSTGIPFKVVFDSSADDFRSAVNLRSMVENGLRFRDRWVNIGGTRTSVKPYWFQKLGLFHVYRLSIFDDIEKQVETLKQIKPDVISGYSSAIGLIARYVKKHNIKEVKPRVIFTTAELLDDDMRTLINSVFDLELIDLFGCVEFDRTAWECSEHQGYHLDSDVVLTEFVRDDENVSAGERGRIIYTGLYNYAMPLIRYDVGDVGVPTDELCFCGRGLPLMKVIEGRTDSFMKNPDGRIFSPMIWTVMMKRMSGIEQFKAIQEKEDLIHILLVKDGNYSERTPNQIECEVKKVMGDMMNVEVELVDKIDQKAGKQLSAISKVDVKI